jgi:hypothetical protein
VGAVSASAEGISMRTLATAIGLSPSRVHQIVADADLDAAIAALGELRAAGWPAHEDPTSDEDTDLDGRDHLAGRLPDEVDWLRQCAGWLRQLDGGSYPPTVNLRPSADWPDRAVVAVDLARVAAVIDLIAAGVDELARALLPPAAPRVPRPTAPGSAGIAIPAARYASGAVGDPRNRSPRSPYRSAITWTLSGSRGRGAGAPARINPLTWRRTPAGSRSHSGLSMITFNPSQEEGQYRS